MKNKALQARLGEEVLSFIDSRRSLQIASLGEDGVPFASYAPFARDDDSLYVILSDIAIHGRNLKREHRASVLVIEDEDSAGELYARVRVSYKVLADALKAGSEAWENGVAILEKRLGERPRKLSELSDFCVFRLRPQAGRYVKGFGKAYTLEGGTLATATINHLREGHRPREDAIA
ncbi:MAG: pyridoxamine 5'-phosphate oxidase family protein [Pseudomonadota bacterium]